jgi:hypothetical protein
MELRLFFLLAPWLLTACNGDIYLRDGVTNGDTFYLSTRAVMDDDPELQSWVRYSLAKSTCQLGMGGENPARNSSYACELTARRHLVEAWQEKLVAGAADTSRYLDELSLVAEKGYLDEYVAHHFQKRHWTLPDNLRLGEYRRWEKRVIPHHESQTRLTGSWNYQARVTAE